jgi:hypothetical protein
MQLCRSITKVFVTVTLFETLSQWKGFLTASLGQAPRLGVWNGVTWNFWETGNVNERDILFDASSRSLRIPK